MPCDAVASPETPSACADDTSVTGVYTREQYAMPDLIPRRSPCYVAEGACWYAKKNSSGSSLALQKRMMLARLLA